MPEWDAKAEALDSSAPDLDEGQVGREYRALPGAPMVRGYAGDVDSTLTPILGASESRDSLSFGGACRLTSVAFRRHADAVAEDCRGSTARCRPTKDYYGPCAKGLSNSNHSTRFLEPDNRRQTLVDRLMRYVSMRFRITRAE